MSATDVLLCDDGSDGAAEAIRAAGELLGGQRKAIALVVWRPLSTYPWAVTGVAMANLRVDVDREALEAASRQAEAAAERAREAGFDAEPMTMRADGPIWQAIVDCAREQDSGVIVCGARGLSGVRRVLLGSVSEHVVRHADRPVLIIHPPSDGDEDGEA